MLKMNEHILSLRFSFFFFLWTARGTALPLEHHGLDVIPEGFLPINCRRRTFTWRYPFHKIFTCVPRKLSWGSRIGGAVLLVGIRWVEGRMYKTGIAWNWTVWWRTHGLEWWVRIGMPLRSVCSRRGASPTLVGAAAEFGMWGRTQALCGKYDRRRLMEYHGN